MLGFKRGPMPGSRDQGETRRKRIDGGGRERVLDEGTECPLAWHSAGKPDGRGTDDDHRI